MGANEKHAAAWHGAAPLDDIKARAETEAILREGDPYFTSLEATAWDRVVTPEAVLRLIAALEAAKAAPELTDQINGDPMFISGWIAAIEEVNARINEALGES